MITKVSILTKKRAVLLRVALSLLSFSASAKTGVTQTIEQAQAMLVQNHRIEALNHLSTALAASGLLPADRRRLLEVQEQIATRFVTDAGQKVFELAQTQLFANPQQALRRLKEAEALEPGNLAIGLATVRAHLLREACDDAQKAIDDLQVLKITNNSVAELTLSALNCSEKYDELAKVLTRFSVSLKGSAALIKLTQARSQLKNGETQKALDLLREGLVLDTQFPLNLYWFWKVSQKLGEEADGRAEEYVRLCKSPTPQLRRKYLNSPEICLRITEVEAYLKTRPAETSERTN